MLRSLLVVPITISIFYFLIYGALYAFDNQVCKRHWYDGNVLEPTLRVDMCYYENSVGDFVYIRVDEVIRSGKTNPMVIDWTK